MVKTSSESKVEAHTVSSNIRKTGTSISVFEGSKAEPLKYNKYFIGRSYKLFCQGIRAKKTLEFYNRQLYHFCQYLDKTTEQLVLEFGPYKKVNGKNRVNLDGHQELQRHLENYVLLLQEKVDRKEIKPSTCVVRIPPLKLFFAMNDTLLNWTKIGKLLPRSDLVAQDETYTREQIQKMLGFCDLRTRIIMLLLASSGIRLGALASLKYGDLIRMYSKETSKLIAVHIKVYSGTNAEYDSFCTPECAHAIEEYISMRKSYGETITAESPIILSRFSRSTLTSGKAKAINDATIQNLLSAIRSKASLAIPSKHYKGRFTIKTAHAFRKYFHGAIKSIKTESGQPAISFVNKERLLGHTLVDAHALEDNYDRSDRVKELLSDYIKAIPELSFSDEERALAQMKAAQLQLAEKDSNLKTIKTDYDNRLAQLEETLSGLKAYVDELTPLAARNIEKVISTTDLEE